MKTIKEYPAVQQEQAKLDKIRSEAASLRKQIMDLRSRSPKERIATAAARLLNNQSQDVPEVSDLQKRLTVLEEAERQQQHALHLEKQAAARELWEQEYQEPYHNIRAEVYNVIHRLREAVGEEQTFFYDALVAAGLTEENLPNHVQRPLPELTRMCGPMNDLAAAEGAMMGRWLDYYKGGI